MHFYFSYGALECGAVYYPGLEGTADEASWVERNADLRYLVVWNPTISSETIKGGDALSLERGAILKIKFPESLTEPPGTIYLFLRNDSEKAVLELFPLNKEGGAAGDEFTEKYYIPAGWSGWQAFTLPDPLAAGGFHIRARRVERPIWLEGFRVDASSPFYWPWNQGVVLTYVSADPDVAPRTIKFETWALFPGLLRPLEVLADRGATVLLKIAD
jgi:hypothetical protein